MTVRVYKSTDTGAPTLSGTAGDFINLLDKCLVAGYNTQAVTSITRTSNTATVTTTGNHGFATGDSVTISGANEADYNGSYFITVTGATTFTYTVANSPATPATGTISSIRSPAGWTKPYTGTNLAAFQQGAGSSNFLLRVDDTTTTYATARGYEAMTAISTGTNPFPTVAQLANGVYFPKSDTASAATRVWVLVATEKAFIYYSQNTATTATASSGFGGFGDITSYKSGDAYNCLIWGDSSSTANVSSLSLSAVSGAVAGHYMARSYTQVGSSLAVGKGSDTHKTNSGTSLGTAGVTYPNGPDGGLWLSPVWVHEPSSPYHIRGKLPGLWNPCHTRSAMVTGGVNNYDTFSGSGDLAGKTFIFLILGSSYCGAIETSDTW